MADFHSKLIRKEEVAEGTMAFYLEKPENFTYLTGQHATFQILNPSETDKEGDNRTFSFITIPTEKEVGFATRMRDTAFKRILKSSIPGLAIDIKNPRGSMVLPSDTKRPLVFLAGGIGITPLFSMIKQATHDKSDHKITLLFSNRTIAQTAFFKDLKHFTNINPNFSFVPVMTQEKIGNWSGETGHISIDLVKKYLPSTGNTLFYTSGPTAMVSAMITMLTEAGIDPIFIKSEDYGEYR